MSPVHIPLLDTSAVLAWIEDLNNNQYLNTRLLLVAVFVAFILR